MTRTWRWMMFVLAATVLIGCSRAGSLKIVIKNDSAVDVTHLMLTGKGFTQTVDRLGPAETKTLTMVPPSASSLSVVGVAADTHMTADDIGYFENSGSYRISITISSNLLIDGKVDLDAMF